MNKADILSENLDKMKIKDAKEYTERIKKKNDRNDKRTMYFCIGYSVICNYPIHVTIKRLLRECNLNFRVRMS